MKKTQRTWCAIVLAAGAIMLKHTLLAATPFAVWDGDFSELTQGNLTIDINGNTRATDNSYLRITGENGILVNHATSGGMNVYTMLVRCSGLNLSAEKAQVLFTSRSNINNNQVGVNLPANNAVVRGIWNGDDWNDGATQASVPENYTTLCYNHQQKSGTYLYAVDADGGITTLYSVVGLRSSGAAYSGTNIGGLHTATSTTLLPATGLTITGIAVFNSTLTQDEMKGYNWPSDIVQVEVASDTTVSQLNTQIPAGKRTVVFNCADGVKLTVNEAFSDAVSVLVASEGSIMLVADEKPEAIGADFSAVAGAVLRSWLEPGVVGFNFNANGGRENEGTADGCANTALALEIGEWSANASSASGTSATMFADGLSTLTWSSRNVYAEQADLTAGSFIQGYLDDGNGGVRISLSNVPYRTYDLIVYCSTDDSTKSFKAVTVNGTIYTWDATLGKVVTTSDTNATWGLASAAAGKAVIGANTIRINGLTGPLTIAGGTNGNGARGCIAAIQIMPAGTSTTPTMALSTNGDWTDATKWEGGHVATANAILKVTGDVTLTVSESVELTGGVTVEGTEGSLTIRPATGKTFTASSLSSALPIHLDAGVTIPTLSAPVTYLYKTATVESAMLGATYTKGTGESDGAHTAMGLNGGTLTLTSAGEGDVYYLRESFTGTQTAVSFVDAVASYSDILSVGQAAYTLSGKTAVTTPRFILSQGAVGRTATFTMAGESSLTVTGASNPDSNQASIMIGHYNGPSTLTISDSATFTAKDAQMLVGKTGNNQTITLNGGVLDVLGIKVSSGATGTNMLNLNGGEIKLGDVGITASGSSRMAITLGGMVTVTTQADSVPVTQTFVDDEDLTHALIKKGSGTLFLGTSRPRMDVQEGRVSVTVLPDELVSGKIVLKVPENASEDVDEKFLVVASSGEEVGILSAAVDQTAHTITLTLDVNTAITESGNISELIADGTTGRVTINGANAEEPIAIMFDEIPSGIDEVLIVGTVIVRGALTDKVTFAPGASVLVDTEMEITLTKVEPTAVIRVVEGGNLKLYFSGVAQTDFTYQQTVRVEEGGVYDVAVESGRNKDYSHPIVLAGGTLTNSGEAATVNSRQYWQTSLEADSFLDVPENEFGAVNSQYAQHTFILGGHKLTKTGPGQFTFRAARFVGGGTLQADEGKLILASCSRDGSSVNLVLGAAGEIEIDNGTAFGKPGAVTGSGLLSYPNGVATNNGPIFQDNTWAGTVWLKNMVWNGWDLGRDGNGTGTASPSKIRLTGVKGYSGGEGCNVEIVLQDEGNVKALLATNGSSNATYWFNKFSGAGTFGWDIWDETITAGPVSGHIFWIKDVSDYTGQLVTGEYLHFKIGATAPEGRTPGAITVADGATICPGNWLAKTITFGQTLTVKGEKGALVATVDEEPRFGKVWVALLDEEGNPRKGSYVLKTKAVDDGYEIRVEQTGLTVVIR